MRGVDRGAIVRKLAEIEADEHSACAAGDAQHRTRDDHKDGAAPHPVMLRMRDAQFRRARDGAK
jgi:hypothetical protein